MRWRGHTWKRPGTAIIIIVLAGLIATALGLGALPISGARPGIRLDDLTTSAIETRVPLPGPVTLLTAPKLVLERGTLSPAEPGSLSPETAPPADAHRLLVEDAVLSLDADSGSRAKEGGANTMVALLAEALSKIAFDAVAFRNGTLKINRSDGQQEVLESVNADVVLRGGTGMRFAGTFRYEGQDVAFDAALGDSESGRRAVRAAIKNALISLNLSGQLSFDNGSELTADNSEISVPSLRNAARWLGTPWPRGLGLIDFHAKGRLTIASDAITVEDAHFDMDGNQATGTLQLALSRERPAIAGTLALSELDLTPYFPAAAHDVATSGNRDFSPATLEEPPWAILRHIDTDVRISTDRIVSPVADFGRAAVALSSENGRLLADIAELEIAPGGSGSGQLGLDATSDEPRIEVSGKLSSLDAARVTNALLGHAVLGGEVEIKGGLNASGSTAEEMLATLSGKLAVELPNGGRLGFDASRLSAAAQDASGGGWGNAGSRPTPVTTFTSSFVFADGIASAGVSSTTREGSGLLASGTISLPARSLNLKMSFGRTIASPDGAERLTADEVITMRGAWSGPSLMSERLPGRALAPPPEPQPPDAGTAALGPRRS